jgi:probable rRNA maturation factor
MAELALERCATHSGDGHFALRELAEVGVAIVSDAVIARLHLEFMGIEGPTDVLTFHHGEVVISADTAAAHAEQRRHAVEVEIALYTVHGFLHLNGFDDRTSPEAARMRRTQSRILRWCRLQLPPP